MEILEGTAAAVRRRAGVAAGVCADDAIAARGKGHSPDTADKAEQVDPGSTGCPTPTKNCCRRCGRLGGSSIKRPFDLTGNLTVSSQGKLINMIVRVIARLCVLSGAVVSLSNQGHERMNALTALKLDLSMAVLTARAEAVIGSRAVLLPVILRGIRLGFCRAPRWLSAAVMPGSGMTNRLLHRHRCRW